MRVPSFRSWMGGMLAVCMTLCMAIGATALPLAAQIVPDSTARADSIRQARVDSVAAKVLQDSVRDARNRAAQARIDSIVRRKAADTIKAPLAHFEAPDTPELSDRLTFDRKQILSSGAINLADLLDRVPGVTTFRTGWMAGIHVAAYTSDFERIRIFYDGVERDAIDARNNGVLDLDDIPLWTLEQIIIERLPGEVRVWLRGFTVQRTTPYTRVDIFTGDLNTNGFRGIFARRFGNGLSLQFTGQQLATQSGRLSASGQRSGGNGDGDQKFADIRIGWARKLWTLDLTGTSISRDRDSLVPREGFTTLPSYKGARREGYARVAYGDSLRGLWGQALVGVVRTRLEGIAGVSALADSTTLGSTASSDTVRARTQQILTIGYRTGWWHASIIDRARPVEGTLFHAPAVRAGIGRGIWQVSAYGEQRALDSLRTVDVSGTVRPLPWLAMVAAHSTRNPMSSSVRQATTASRAEAAVRVNRLWVGGGIVRESDNTFASPVIIGAPDSLISVPASTGLLGSIHGGLYKDLRLDVQVVRWNTAQYSRPRMTVRTELALISDWRGHFPKGEFSIDTRIIHELRNSVPFYWVEDDTFVQRNARNSQVVIGQLEIRIQSATLFYQYRNLTGQRYEQIPGITMPPAVQLYGVRWDFWN